MIGADRGDIAEPVAKRALFVGLPKGRRALGERAELFHVAGREHEVMRTSFASHIDSFRPRVDDQRDTGSAADMNNVKPAAGFRRNVNRAADRLEFGGDWS